MSCLFLISVDYEETPYKEMKKLEKTYTKLGKS